MDMGLCDFSIGDLKRWFENCSLGYLTLPRLTEAQFGVTAAVAVAVAVAASPRRHVLTKTGKWNWTFPTDIMGIAEFQILITSSNCYQFSNQGFN